MTLQTWKDEFYPVSAQELFGGFLASEEKGKRCAIYAMIQV